jgi:nucleoside-diphosphate-sugar epimerase
MGNKIKNKKILITGGAGFIGTALSKKLIKDNFIILYDNLWRDALKYNNLVPKNHFKFLKGEKIAEKESKILEELNLKPKSYYLATVHRAENTEEKNRLVNIVNAFCQIKNIVFSCHPRTENYLKKI